MDLVNCLIFTIIFSLFLSFLISVECSWRCLGAKEYKTTVQQEFADDFKSAYPNYKSFRDECEAMNSLLVTLDTKLTAQSKSDGVAELKTCGRWIFDPQYRCRVSLDNGAWDGMFRPLLSEYDCIQQNQHCWWKLHEGYLLRHSPKESKWIRQDYEIDWRPLIIFPCGSSDKPSGAIPAKQDPTN